MDIVFLQVVQGKYIHRIYIKKLVQIGDQNNQKSTKNVAKKQMRKIGKSDRAFAMQTNVESEKRGKQEEGGGGKKKEEAY